MHDHQIEGQLRADLRTEADRLALTITAAELERRLVARRRATNGRRLSLVAAALAAVAIGGMVAVSNGWVQFPTAATQPSPSPTASPDSAPSAPSLGIERIAPGDAGRVLLEIEPQSSGAGDSRTIHRDLEPTDYVVSVAVRCLGSGSLSITERKHTTTDNCEPAGGGSGAAIEPIVALVPIGNGSLDLTFAATPDVVYTMLIETVPVPTRLPALDTPEGTVAIDVSSDKDHPSGDASGGSTTTRTVGQVPESLFQDVVVACIGPGVVDFALGPVGQPDAATSSEVICNGEPMRLSLGVGTKGQQDLTITADVRTAWHVIATYSGTLPIFTPPSLIATSWLAGEGRDAAGTVGRVGCGLSYHLADGRVGAEHCPTPAIPDVTDIALVSVPPGGELRFQIDPPWTITEPVITMGPVTAGAPSVRVPFTLEGHGILHAPISFADGEYLVSVGLSAKSGGTTYHAPYWFIVTVAP